MRTIRKAVIKHKIVDFLKEVGIGIMAGIVIGVGFLAVFFLYCRIAGPFVITFR